MLSSLTEWSAQHIAGVFEACTDDDALRAIDTTFSATVSASLNHKPLSRQGIEALVLSMRQQAVHGLKVEWKQTVDMPIESSNRSGSFGGVYHLSGIQRQLTGEERPSSFERRKAVIVRIESQEADPDRDTRRIVDLAFVAVDVQID